MSLCPCPFVKTGRVLLGVTDIGLKQIRQVLSVRYVGIVKSTPKRFDSALRFYSSVSLPPPNHPASRVRLQAALCHPAFRGLYPPPLPPFPSNGASFATIPPLPGHCGSGRHTRMSRAAGGGGGQSARPGKIAGAGAGGAAGGGGGVGCCVEVATGPWGTLTVVVGWGAPPTPPPSSRSGGGPSAKPPTPGPFPVAVHDLASPGGENRVGALLSRRWGGRVCGCVVPVLRAVGRGVESGFSNPTRGLVGGDARGVERVGTAWPGNE